MNDLIQQLKDVIDEPDQFTDNALSDIAHKAIRRIQMLEASASRHIDRTGKLTEQVNLLLKQYKILDDGLDKLSRLGNGSELGTSEGNTLAHNTRHLAKKLNANTR